METLFKKSSQVVSDMLNFSMQTDAPANIVPTGSGPEAGRMITAQPRLSHDELLDLLSLIRPQLLSLIKRETLKDPKGVLRALELAQQRANKEEVVYWISRMLAHFPGRDVTKDAIILSDITRDLLEAGVTTAGVCEACRLLRQAGDKDNPFLPSTGEIEREIKDQTTFLGRMHLRAAAMQ